MLPRGPWDMFEVTLLQPHSLTTQDYLLTPLTTTYVSSSVHSIQALVFARKPFLWRSFTIRRGIMEGGKTGKKAGSKGRSTGAKKYTCQVTD